MTRPIAMFVALLATACPSPGPEADACAPRPAELDRACDADGECGEWLVCRNETCALPAAVAGTGGETLAVVIDDQEASTVQVEVARGDLARERGLGDRPCIAEGWGLLIEFPQAGDHLITARSMRFDLDLAFAGDDRVVHAVYPGVKAGTDVLYGAGEPVRYVLETPTGDVEVLEGASLVF